MSKEKKKKVSKESKKTSRGTGKKYQRDARYSVEKCSHAPPSIAKTTAPMVVRTHFQRKGARAKSTTLSRSIEKREDRREDRSAAQKWCDDVLATGLRNIRKVFVDSVKPYVPEGTRSAFADDANAEKNRYDDVELLDRTRVRITINPDDDYIHASVVEVSPHLRIICAQGPLDNTVAQFWIMVVEQSSKVILQLCQNFEDGKEKCAEYMPPTSVVGNVLDLDTVKVKVVDANMSVGAMKRVTRTRVEVAYQQRIWETTHLLYAGWPDHSVPTSLPTYMELRSLILRIYDKKPIITHCSAGVGRTGSYAAIELAIYQLTVRQNREFNMVEAVRKLRQQRMHAVQNDQQYVFIHRMVLEVLLSESRIEKSARLAKFFKEYDDLVERKRAELGKMKGASKKSKKNE